MKSKWVLAQLTNVGDPAENLEKAKKYAKQAYEEYHPDFMIFPEVYMTHYPQGTPMETVLAAAQPLDGPFVTGMRKLAKDNGIWLLADYTAAAFVINPMKGIARIARGDSWRVRNTHYKYHDSHRLPVKFSMSAGWRYLADKGKLSGGESNPFIDLFLVYGHAVDGERHTTPYDFFDVDITFGLSSNQPFINDLHIVGRLWSTPILDKNGKLGEFGIYQHFNYYDSKPVIDGSDQTPYRISEPAALGPGFIFAGEPQKGFVSSWEQRLFLDAILLGGTKSDYFNVLERDYNMGSGFSLKSKTHLEFGNWGRFDLHVKYFSIFTWVGYKKSELKMDDLHYLNVQGDEGNAGLFVVTPIFEADLWKRCSLTVSGTFYHRHTHYREHSDKDSKTYETKVGLTYYF